MPAEQFDEALTELARTIAANAPLAVAYAKQAIEVGTESSLAAGLEFESAAIRVLFGSDDYAEGLGVLRRAAPAAVPRPTTAPSLAPAGELTEDQRDLRDAVRAPGRTLR